MLNCDTKIKFTKMKRFIISTKLAHNTAVHKTESNLFSGDTAYPIL